MTVTLEPQPVPLRLDGGDVLRVGGTRVTLETVMEAFDSGASPEEVVLRYPALELADVYAVIAHSLRHADEVHAYRLEAERRATAARAEAEARFPPEGLRARLLARRSR